MFFPLIFFAHLLSYSLPALCEQPVATFEYQAEVNRLMHTIIHSMYSEKEVFIRELLSNASDALDKLRRLALEDQKVMEPTSDMRILVYTDKVKGTITIEDTGVGMVRKELVDNLGTIAKSGTGDLLKNLIQSGKAGDTSSLIGQFGFGFYSSFLVADSVEVSSKSVEDPDQWKWIGNANETSFRVEKEENTLKRGTRVTLKLREDTKDKFLDQELMKDLITLYSQFLAYPIYFRMQVEAEKDVADKDEADKKEKEDEKDEKEDEPKAKEDKPKEKKLVEKDVLMNPNKPIWLRNPKEVSKEEYIKFYEAYYKDTSSSPPAWIHFHGSGDTNFSALIFIRDRPLYSPFSAKTEKEEQSRTVSLYVKRVFTKREQLFSEAISPFACGIVDSDDLPLNASREILQNNSLMEQIRRKVTNKVLDKLAELAESNEKSDKETFNKFYSSFSSNLKLEIFQKDDHRKRLSKLLLYPTSSHREPGSLSDYVGRMKEGQESIYFIAGRSLEELQNSSLVEGFIAQGKEVILATDPIDEYCLQALGHFEDHKFKNVAKEKAMEGNASTEQQEAYKDLCEWLKKDVLDKEVSDVILSSRLTDSSCAVAASEHGLTGHMESVLKAQVGSGKDPMLHFMTMQKPIFELNPKHAVVIALREAVGKNKTNKGARDIARTIFDAALIRSGYSLKNSKQFMDSVDRLVIKSLEGIRPEEEVKKVEQKETKSETKLEESEPVREEL